LTEDGPCPQLVKSGWRRRGNCFIQLSAYDRERSPAKDKQDFCGLDRAKLMHRPAIKNPPPRVGTLLWPRMDAFQF
jgi:hypothetical protein